MRPLNKIKLFAGLVSAVGAAVLALGVLTAGAAAAPNPGPPLTTNPDGPQSANIPYVAWVGEHVRLVACDPSINASNDNQSTKRQFSTFSTEDWSGYQFQPPTPDGFSGNNLLEEFNPGPSAFFESSSSPHRGTAAWRPSTSRSTPAWPASRSTCANRKIPVRPSSLTSSS